MCKFSCIYVVGCQGIEINMETDDDGSFELQKW